MNNKAEPNDEQSVDGSSAHHTPRYDALAETAQEALCKLCVWTKQGSLFPSFILNVDLISTTLIAGGWTKWKY